MQKVDGAWKIARYCFSTMNPPQRYTRIDGRKDSQ